VSWLVSRLVSLLTAKVFTKLVVALVNNACNLYMCRPGIEFRSSICVP
jgi:hypothetical protein